MRIVAVADTHTFEKNLGTLPEGDIFIHAGDLLRVGTLKELEKTAFWINSLPYKYKIFVAGNHDRCFEENREQACQFLKNVIYLEDNGVTIEGINFWGSPWQPEFNNWAFNLSRGAALAKKWDKISLNTNVLITHGPPLGIGDECFEQRVGCEDLRKRVVEVAPQLHLFGHIHHAGGVWFHQKTCFGNVTTWESERMPTVFDVDSDSLVVKVVSLPTEVDY
ncbi:metallophosphatase domain-containing protein [Candidatus Uabimicrobium sp. HlEnr_7]|uniref:metallophosphatase domain-containing protein n=1 Tax=Candidatus Uabimicrobium helgolandensis TaxID=3095367 RepID=UPI003556B0DB